jgi:hypothetical protein
MRFDRVPAEELVYMNSDFSSPSSPSLELYLNINPSRISTALSNSVMNNFSSSPPPPPPLIHNLGTPKLLNDPHHLPVQHHYLERLAQQLFPQLALHLIKQSHGMIVDFPV